MSRSFGKYGGVLRQGNEGPNDDSSGGHSVAEGRGTNGTSGHRSSDRDCDVTTGVVVNMFSFMMVVGIIKSPLDGY